MKTKKEHLTTFFILGIMGTTLLGLMGYLPGLEFVGRLHPGYIPMAPSTALSFLLLGSALFLLQGKQAPRPGYLILSCLLTMLPAVFGLLECFGFFLGRDLSFEDSLFPELGNLQGVPLGRMSPATGALFFLSGLAMIFQLASLRMSPLKDTYLIKLSGILSSLVLLTAFTILLGYLYGKPLLYDQPIIPMAFSTALGFLLLGLGMIWTVGSRHFPLNQIYGSSTHTQLIRAFLPLILIIILSQGLLTHYLLLTAEMNQALLSAALVVVFTLVTALLVKRISVSVGKRIDQADAERVTSETALRESEQKYRGLFNSIRDAILVADTNRQIIDCNQAFSEVFGYSLSEIKGKPTSEVYRDETQFMELGEKIKENIDNPHFLYTVQYRKKSGHIFPGETNVFLLQDKDGNVRGFIGLIRDISERIRTEEHLRKHTEQLASLLDNMFDALVVIDENGVIRYINPSGLRLFDRRKDDLIGQPFGFPLALREPFELEILQESGDIRYAEMQVTTMNWQNESVYLASIRDMTEQKLAMQEREEMNAHVQQIQKMEAIGSLAGGIAHDFNNILSPILGFTEIVRDRVSDDEVSRESLDQVYQAGQRAKTLVKQILAFSRQAETSFQPLSLAPIVKEVMKMLRSTLPSTIEIRQNISSERIVQADATNMHQVLMNLCTNAKQAMEDAGGVLRISLQDTVLSADFTRNYPDLQPGEYIRLQVEDSGEGMDDHVQRNIFEPYFTTKETGQGTGLGLSVVHGIVKKHGGMITVSSQLGKGSLFNVYLPCCQEEDSSEHIEDVPIEGGSEHILFVDDEPSMVRLNQKILESLGYRCTTRTSSLEALELFNTQPEIFDLIITDMTMPNLTGDKLAGECLSIRPDIPIILATGYSEKMDEEKAHHIGIKALLGKPISRNDLGMTIRRMLDADDNCEMEKN